MTYKKLALWAAIPALVVATAALAQTAQTGDQTLPGMHHFIKDPIAWHKEMCANHYAGLAAGLAFLEAKLDLTDAQRGVWSTWRQAWMDDAAKQREACIADIPAQPGTTPTILDDEARAEKMLSARLAGLQARRPALEALYAALTPDQKATLDHTVARFGHEHEHGGMWHHHIGMGGPDGMMDGPDGMGPGPKPESGG